jgi:hypothetical protein
MPHTDDLARGLFFIVGTGRCGTTLLQAMLSCHSRIYIPPETNFFAYWYPGRVGPTPTGAGNRFASVEEARAYIAWASAMRFWPDLQLDEDRLARDTIDLGADAKALFLAAMTQFRERSGKPHLGEKTPIHRKHVKRIARDFPDARFIGIYRDPRDTVTSMLGLDWGRHGSAYRHARTWARSMRLQVEHEQLLGPERFTTLRYESLIEDPEAELRRLCAFLGEDFQPDMLHPEQRKDPGFNERETRWKGLTLSPVSKQRIGRYREKLRPEQVWIIEKAVGDRYLRAGHYEPCPDLPVSPTWYAKLAGAWAHCTLAKYNRSLRKRLGANEEQTNVPQQRVRDVQTTNA